MSQSRNISLSANIYTLLHRILQVYIRNKILCLYYKMHTEIPQRKCIKQFVKAKEETVWSGERENEYKYFISKMAELKVIQEPYSITTKEKSISKEQKYTGNELTVNKVSLH